MTRALKILIIFLGTIMLIFGGFYLFLHIAFDGIFTGPSYDKKDLMENFEERKAEIFDVKEYFISILPEGASVSLEFKKDKELSIFHIRTDSIHERNWKLQITSPKVDSLLTEINWTTKELLILRDKLAKANCISIAGKDPVVIGWQRSGMGIFSYNIFNDDLEIDRIAKYNDACTYTFYKDNIVLEYAGGAIGPQCFPEFYNN